MTPGEWAALIAIEVAIALLAILFLVNFAMWATSAIERRREQRRMR